MFKSFRYRFLPFPKKLLSQLNSKVMSIETVVLVIYRVNDLKTGTLVGTDKYGNKYYEDTRNFFGMCVNVNTSWLTVWVCIDCMVSAGGIELVACPTSSHLTCVSLRKGAHRNALKPSASLLLPSIHLQTCSIWHNNHRINLSQSSGFYVYMPIWECGWVCVIYDNGMSLVLNWKAGSLTGEGRKRTVFKTASQPTYLSDCFRAGKHRLA